MYCLQWLIPVLLIPKPWQHPLMLYEHAVFIWVYIIGFFVERRPCYICTVIFVAAVALVCYSSPDTCIFVPGCSSKDGESCDYVSSTTSGTRA